MNIQSAFNSGVQGFQQAQNDASKAAEDIVKSTTFSSDEYSQDAATQDAASIEPSQNTQAAEAPNLTQSIVDLKVAEFQAKASAEVIQTSDDVLGTLLDVTA